MRLDGVDTGWVREQAASFLDETTPEFRLPGGPVGISTRPRCGRDQALALTGSLRPILDRVDPGWRSASTSTDEFGPERDACHRLIAYLDSHAEHVARLGDSAPDVVANALHPVVWSAARTQWASGHRHEAVLAAAKAVNTQLQQRLARTDVSETKLFQEAFSPAPPTPGKPRLRLPLLGNKPLEPGVSQFASGCFAAIRNPLGHVPNKEIALSEQEALEQLAAWSLLARWVERASVVAAL